MRWQKQVMWGWSVGMVAAVLALGVSLAWGQSRHRTNQRYIFENGIETQGPSTILPQTFGIIRDVILCGDLPNNTTNYTSPVSGYAGGIVYSAGLTATDLSFSLAGTGCSAEDNATEATADEVMFANNAFQVIGLACTVSGSGSNGVTINLRSAAANLSTNVSVTIPTTTTTAATVPDVSPTVAAGATFAARAITTEDLSAQDFWCIATIRLVP